MAFRSYRAFSEGMATEMALCLFCPTELDETTKPEHILLNALGGRKATTRAICSDCNNKFGGTIDDVLASQVTGLRMSSDSNPERAKLLLPLKISKLANTGSTSRVTAS